MFVRRKEKSDDDDDVDGGGRIRVSTRGVGEKQQRPPRSSISSFPTGEIPRCLTTTNVLINPPTFVPVSLASLFFSPSSLPYPLRPGPPQCRECRRRLPAPSVVSVRQVRRRLQIDRIVVVAVVVVRHANGKSRSPPPPSVLLVARPTTRVDDSPSFSR